MDKKLDLKRLISQVDKESTKRQVFVQLLKDFNRAGVSLGVDEKSSTEQWVYELITVLNDLNKNNSTQLEQLLYLIDLPQEYYTKTQELQNEEFGIFFAQLLLMRTLKKIAFRNQYS
jgi:hypothetical protein